MSGVIVGAPRALLLSGKLLNNEVCPVLRFGYRMVISHHATARMIRVASEARTTAGGMRLTLLILKSWISGIGERPTTFLPATAEICRDNSATLGTTYDSASVSVASNSCGDIRDTMTAEYTSDHSPYHPRCDNYMSSTAWDFYFAGYPGIYDFNTLTTDEASPYQSSGWPILQPQLEIGLTYMGEQLGGQVFSITSGYRNPQAEIDAAKQNHTQPHMGSRHMAGDAADISTQYNSTFWLQVHDAGIQNGGCVEPVSGSTLSHLHVDWRMASTQFTGVGCAAPWKQ